jgi:hypothetical protein
MHFLLQYCKTFKDSDELNMLETNQVCIYANVSFLLQFVTGLERLQICSHTQEKSTTFKINLTKSTVQTLLQ